jgi:hypothetical protein
MEIQHVTEQRIVADSSRAETGFWKRQFGATVTQPQIFFDVTFGVVGPVLCFVFDPIIFRSWLMGPPLLGDYQTFAYLFSGLQITLLSFWLLTGPGWQPWNRLMGGMLLSGTVFCVIIGFVLAPFSLIGLIYGVGLFGLTPFLTALVYLRNSCRAWRAENNDAESLAAALIGVSGILLVSGLPLLLSIQIHLTVSRAVAEIIEGDSQHAMFAAHRLVPLRFFADAELDQIVNAYTFAKDEKRKELLKSCYREITGDSIENRAPILRD